MNENLNGDFFKNSNEVYHDMGYDYCKCKEESSEFLTSFCLSILEGYYSRNRKMLSGIGSGAGGAHNRGRYIFRIRFCLNTFGFKNVRFFP